MINYYDSIDLAIIGKSFVKKDLFFNLVKKNKINLKNYHIIGIDDKLGILKITKLLQEQGFKSTGFWINRENFPRYKNEYYDYEIFSLKEVIKFIKNNKIKKPLILADFDNTLAKANYEVVTRNTKESIFWEKMPINFLTTILVAILAPFTYFTILIDLIKHSNIPYRESKEFKNYLIKNNILTWVISYRNKYLQKKYF
ncbi:MAG: hypothetical protein PHN56_01040 [Candidatus Nanoarchaeia archaeon]|nr:hypothetical protein [Candidatus Nanoarchaeia archaeon]